MTHQPTNPCQSPTTPGATLDSKRGPRASLYPSAFTIATLVVGAAATRLAPHWWNLTAIGAVCLFGGAYFERKWAAFFVPLAALAISDVLLQMFVYPGFGFGPNYFKYVCFAVTVPLGFALRGRTTLLPVASAALGATALFFLLSNFEVWLSGHGVNYPRTPAGLIACYAAALPFAKNMLYGNLLFTAVLFGGMELVKFRRAVVARSAASAVPAV